MLLLTKVGQAIRALTSRRLTILSDGIPYEFRDLPLRKVANAILTETSVYFKPRRPWGHPTHLMVEPSTLCNLRCSLCPITSGLERPQGNMSLDLFKKILDEVGPWAFTLQLWDWGEPFMNKQIFDMIAYAKGKGVKVITSSNGHLFANPGMAEKLVRSGLDTIIFAIDGVTQKTYEQYRQEGNLETALEGIRQVVAAKKALGAATPTVNFRFIVMAQNEHEIPKVRALAPALGVDVLTFKTLNPNSNDPSRAGVLDPAGPGQAFLPQQVRYHRFKSGRPGSEQGGKLRRRNNPCKHLWNSPCFHWNGNVSPCTYDPRDRWVLGNVAQDSFAQVWRGERYAKARISFRRDWNQLPVCGECSYAYEGGSCNCETMAEAVFYPREPIPSSLPTSPAPPVSRIGGAALGPPEP
jgi:radical SAM protein with 4Fe4S-binding SPASM domain